MFMQIQKKNSKSIRHPSPNLYQYQSINLTPKRPIVQKSNLQNILSEIRQLQEQVSCMNVDDIQKYCRVKKKHQSRAKRSNTSQNNHKNDRQPSIVSQDLLIRNPHRTQQAAFFRDPLNIDESRKQNFVKTFRRDIISSQGSINKKSLNLDSQNQTHVLKMKNLQLQNRNLELQKQVLEHKLAQEKIQKQLLYKRINKLKAERVTKKNQISTDTFADLSKISCCYFGNQNQKESFYINQSKKLPIDKVQSRQQKSQIIDLIGGNYSFESDQLLISRQKSPQNKNKQEGKKIVQAIANIEGDFNNLLSFWRGEKQKISKKSSIRM